jgi:membrane dipeptidase
VQIVGLGSFVKHQPARGEAISALGNEAAAGSPEYEAGMAAIEAEYPEGVLKDFIDHIVYAVDLIGVDHVGIVSDFDGGGGLPGWNSAAETMNVTKALIGRGYNEEEIGKIWSGNMIATWRRVDEAAAKLN